MLSLITVLGWKKYEYDYEVAVVYLDTPPEDNQSLSEVLNSENLTEYTIYPINETVTRTNLSDFNLTDTAKLYVYPVTKRIQLQNQTINMSVSYSLNDALSKIRENTSAKFLMIPSTYAYNVVYYNYWVPAVANALVPVLVLVLLSIWGLIAFAQISVQTKFVKKD